MQLGSFPDHFPSAWQYRVVANDALNPLLQVYVAVLPKFSPELRTTLPLAGELKLGHDSATRMPELNNKKVIVRTVIFLKSLLHINRVYLPTSQVN